MVDTEEIYVSAYRVGSEDLEVFTVSSLDDLEEINDGNYSKMKNGGSSFVSFTDPTTGLTWGVPLQGGRGDILHPLFFHQNQK